MGNDRDAGVNMFKRVLLSIFLVISLLPVSNLNAIAEECRVYDLGALFYDEYYPDLRWTNDSMKEITWSAEVTEVEGQPVVRPFSSDQLDWLRLGFKSWDMATEKISFKEVSKDANPDVKVGLVPLADPNNHGFWNIKRLGSLRSSGAIRINSNSRFITEKEYFLEVAQSEIGNLLGLGDIRESAGIDSVMMDPDLPPWGSYPLSDIDVGLVRQFYGESTCPSSWPSELKALKDAKALEIKQAQEAEQRAKEAEEARKKAEAELAAKLAAQSASPTPTPSTTISTQPVIKRITITCVKGKLVKKVTGTKPKCPVGYKKR